MEPVGGSYREAVQALLPLSGPSRGESPHTGGPEDLEGLFRPTSTREIELAMAALEARRIQLTHLYDKLSSLSNSRTRLLPHQLEATHRVVSALRPRFLLADEVGLGKTIEAGLIMKELILRREYRRVLVVVPAPLAIQWQQEMQSKFNERFQILNRSNFFQSAARWGRSMRVITSIDFIKNERYADEVLKTRWDLVVFDEAHRLRRDYSKVTRAYAFAENIAGRCDALLLLSATPFRGKLEELYYLIRLVDPDLLGPHACFLQDYCLPAGEEVDGQRMADLRTRVGRVMLRRRKVDVGGFTKRFARTIRFELSPEERVLYDETTEYVRREYNLALREKNRAVSFIMIVFQKLLDSSTAALLKALERRKADLEQKAFGAGRLLTGAGRSDADEDFLEDLGESEEPEEYLERLTAEARQTLKDLRREILTLNFLIRLGRSVTGDRKLGKLLETLQKLRKSGTRKFIIFTQFRTTQDYLAQHLGQHFTVTSFHGSLSMRAKEDAIQEFKEQTEILICTEAGGEGRNLQFANVLFNYDLPWSPLKIEQRIGRVHRFGQEHDVYIFNFATRDTVAERVLEVLEHKIKLFAEAIGPPDTLLGALEDEQDFEQSLMQFVSGRKSSADLDQELESRMRISESGYQKLGDLVTPRLMDFNLDDYYQHTREGRSVDNEQIEALTLQYLRLAESGYRLRQPAKSDGPLFVGAPRTSDYIVEHPDGKRKPATFRSEGALENENWEFLAIGHGLVDEALSFLLNHEYRHALVEVAAGGPLEPGLHFVFLCEYLGGLNRSELLAARVMDDGSVTVHGPEGIQRPQPADCRIPEAALSIDDLSLPYRQAANAVRSFAAERGRALLSGLHSVFKKEEYKLEISYGRKARQLEERRDRQRLRHRIQPSTANRAQLTRTENELLRVRREGELRIGRVRRENRVETQLALMQVYRVVR
ncbi:MAG: DEAD/DEAH box helicase family protein [Spirochaetales bacterium]|nr:DEAD/DEAH box helicase family protein [Leptospiraceae bacterium]MCP5483729.1 DEAD/DEAH box helicase family protein [Spirochaetales bacterium]MCP5484786.1 DEAD/DEAH box helicase family protein [Spirochaetales bacterium]